MRSNSTTRQVIMHNSQWTKFSFSLSFPILSNFQFWKFSIWSFSILVIFNLNYKNNLVVYISADPDADPDHLKKNVWNVWEQSAQLLRKLRILEKKCILLQKFAFLALFFNCKIENGIFKQLFSNYLM